MELVSFPLQMGIFLFTSVLLNRNIAVVNGIMTPELVKKQVTWTTNARTYEFHWWIIRWSKREAESMRNNTSVHLVHSYYRDFFYRASS